MTVDSKYSVEKYKEDKSVEYTIEFESIGEEALEVYVVAPVSEGDE